MASAKKKSKPAKRPAKKSRPAKKPKPAKKVAKPAKKAAKPAKRPPKKARPAAPPKAKPPAAKGGIAAGSRAPTFTLKDQSGQELASSALAGAPYVLYFFYPKDDTSGCTKEACGFRDSFRSFGASRARVVGVSPDSEASHARFVQKYGLPFTLLADPEKVLANAYGVWVKKQNYGREYMGILRSTFVVDAKGVVQKAWRGVKVDGHVDAVLAAVQALS